MTLVAAFVSNGIPVLLGDFLLTRDAEQSGLRKKVHVITPNFAVGWTGHLIAAATVHDDLSRRFNNCRVTKRDLEGFLTGYPTADLASVSVCLIGWFVDEEPHCFMWRSDYPEEVFYDDYYYEGSGGSVFLATAGAQTAANTTGLVSVKNALRECLYLAGRLINDELLLSRNQHMGFGHAYEIVFWDSGRFRYLDNILYLSWDFVFNNEGEILEENLYNVYYKYRAFSDFAIIQVSDLENKHTQIHGITAVYGEHQESVRLVQQ